MNRAAFLSTLPFLYEVPSTDWPPTISEDTGRTRRQTLFLDHFLSLEPRTKDSEEPLGPAYFLPSAQQRGNFDAAMCKFEMMIFTTSKKTPYKMSARTPNKSPASKALEVEFKEFITFMNIDDRVYQVDLQKVTNVTLKGMEAGSATKNMPPCLLLQFPNCFFRIFSLVNSATDRYAVLDAAKNEILSVLNGDHYCPFPTKEFVDSLTSPMGSTSTGPNSEPGQKETSAARLPSEDSSSRKSKPDKEKLCQAKTQKCLTSLKNAQDDLESLRRLLKPKAQQSQSTEELRTTASNLLTSVAENVSASYCTREELVTAASGFDKDIDSCRTQLDTLLKTVWPSVKSRPQKRARRPSGSKKPDQPTLPQDVQENCIQHVEMLLAEHKQALRSKYALAQLPTRG